MTPLGLNTGRFLSYTLANIASTCTSTMASRPGGKQPCRQRGLRWAIGKCYPPNMSQQLLLAAREQAERSESAVRAAALMHIARVLARSDQVAA